MAYPVQTSDTAPYSYWTSWTGGAVLTRGNAVQAVKGISLQKVAKDGSINYTMEPISNIEWEFNNSFSILPLLTKEGCRAACLED